MRVIAITYLALIIPALAQKLAQPNINDCMSRLRHAQFNGNGYFFSWANPETKNLSVSWMTGRNICRRHCMELVSMETDLEFNFIKQSMISNGVPFIWTSGRKCNFEGCQNRADLEPIIVRGWFWTGSGVKLGTNPSGTRVGGHWSYTGGDGQSQPDNREFRLTGKNDEACLGMLNNFYGDGVVWHDIACYHKKPFVCEDNPELLKSMRTLYPSLIF